MAIKYTLPPPSFAVSPKKDIGAPDGDTIKIEQPIRMVSCDTPEKEKPFGKATTTQPKLEKVKQRLESGFFSSLPAGLRNYLKQRIISNAAKNHINAGKDASAYFEKTKNERLNLPNGKRRKVGVLPSGEVIDRNGRLLAYITPYFEKDLPPIGDPSRDTFNLVMVRDGWASFFPLWPSLPKKYEDFQRFHKLAQKAWSSKKGMWKKYGSKLLMPYEYRLLMKLSADKPENELIDSAFQRLCVDLRNMKLMDEFSFYKVPPGDRFWIWKDDWNSPQKKAVIKKHLNVKE
jgi:endonuclease YncB( thermonuclease family)